MDPGHIFYCFSGPCTDYQSTLCRRLSMNTTRTSKIRIACYAVLAAAFILGCSAAAGVTGTSSFSNLNAGITPTIDAAGSGSASISGFSFNSYSGRSSFGSSVLRSWKPPATPQVYTDYTNRTPRTEISDFLFTNWNTIFQAPTPSCGCC
jgi:hypothetical protein